MPVISLFTVIGEELRIYPSAQIESVIQALAFGFVLGIFYDLFRILRRVFSFSYATIVAQDILFWLCAAVYSFFVCIVMCGGYFRIYFVLGILAGWGIYFFSVGALLMGIMDIIISGVKKVRIWLHDRILTPLVSNFCKSFMSNWQKITEKIKKCTKLQKRAKKC